MLLTLALLALLSPVAPDSLPGTWQIKGDVMGTPVNEICTIRQEGTALSGSCTMVGGKSYELKGEVSGERFTFEHGGEYDGSALTITYSGALPSATEMKGSIDVQPFGVNGSFTAVPVAPAP